MGNIDKSIDILKLLENYANQFMYFMEVFDCCGWEIESDFDILDLGIENISSGYWKSRSLKPLNQ